MTSLSLAIVHWLGPIWPQRRRTSCLPIASNKSLTNIIKQPHKSCYAIWYVLHLPFLFYDWPYRYGTFPLQVDNGVIPIPKSVTKTRISENIDIFDFKLTEDEIKLIDTFNKNERTINFWESLQDKHWPFAIEY